ncbi:YfbU family protein [Euryhalocaulis caribicus]|uniref:YfbU family protein n=1 Tax=Euryhalocaulis caribicus TaxID=1161401 RepID=UPI0003B4A169|nr:YfbU family protein [Euryhalocaulis caribicus]
MEISPTERLIITMLCDLQIANNVRGEVDPNLVKSAVIRGHDWMFNWEYEGIVGPESDNDELPGEVADILDMWSIIEVGFARLSEEDQERVRTEAELRGDPQFTGFDGNNETDHFAAARFMVNQMGRFTEFADRTLNSHGARLERYRAMYRQFRPIRDGLGDRMMNVEELVTLLKR